METPMAWSYQTTRMTIDNAFHRYHYNNLYIETVCALVGCGDADVGAHRVLSVMGSKFPELYAQEDQSKGLTMKKHLTK
jgi:hypothetical protein